MSKRHLEQAEVGALSLEIIRVLDGVTVGQARWVLRETELMLGEVSRLSVASPDFVAQVQECERACHAST